ncbi:MAG: AAA family ATPase [Planctomycetes bacterium]|nr:AAA family ATPase [Planctomycetota bacterium]
MNDAEKLIDALRDPGCYDHPVEQVEVLQTHISWVLLAGDFAYKVKKPVNLPFVDFSTLEKRRFFCEEELRLNRRLAEELYLAVAPIAGPVESPRVGGAGEAIEYAVKMRRFPQDGLLSRLLEQGRLSGKHIDRLARQAADFHGRAAVADLDRPWGSAENVRQPIEENFEELLAATPDDSPLHSRLLDLQAWNREQLEKLGQTLEGRRQYGYIRECHGDMHLGNIVLLPKEDGGEIVIFDGIEFNENFRWIDVQNDIAFPVMDLEERGRPDLARRLLNVYLEASGDYEGLAVLPLYLNYRALVRAKIDWIRGHQAGVAGRQRRRLEEEFARYLSLAEHYGRPPHPRLFLTCGVSGSGKSHFARRLAERVGAVQIRSDVERKRMFADSPPEKLYSKAATQQTYGRLADLTLRALGAGFSVVVDATFLSQRRRTQFRRLADRMNVSCILLDFRTSPETLQARIRARQQEGRDPSDANLQILARQLAAREPLTEEELRGAIILDTESPEQLDKALTHLASAPQ